MSDFQHPVQGLNDAQFSVITIFAVKPRPPAQVKGTLLFLLKLLS